MKRRYTIFALAMIALSLASCGGSDTSNTLPQPTDPNQVTPQPLPIPTPGTNGVPDLTRAANIQLATPNDYSRFSEMLQSFIYQPVVGNPKILISAIASRQMPGNTQEGSWLILGIEDNTGWQGLKMFTYDDASTVTPSAVNLIFSDSLLTVWVTGSINANGQLAGQILYRNRTGNETQCQPIEVQCDPSWYGQSYCDYVTSYYRQQAVNECMSYLSGMTALGSFTQTLSTWITVN